MEQRQEGRQRSLLPDAVQPVHRRRLRARPHEHLRLDRVTRSRRAYHAHGTAARRRLQHRVRQRHIAAELAEHRLPARVLAGAGQLSRVRSVERALPHRRRQGAAAARDRRVAEGRHGAAQHHDDRHRAQWRRHLQPDAHQRVRVADHAIRSSHPGTAVLGAAHHPHDERGVPRRGLRQPQADRHPAARIRRQRQAAASVQQQVLERLRPMGHRQRQQLLRHGIPEHLGRDPGPIRQHWDPGRLHRWWRAAGFIQGRHDGPEGRKPFRRDVLEADRACVPGHLGPVERAGDA